MRKMMNISKKILKDEDGAALVEYGMLVGLIALVCIGAVTLLGEKIRDVFDAINAELNIPAGD
jgi:pilus assembly protein Flp/PilA